MTTDTMTCAELADYHWLTSDEGRAVVDEVTADWATGGKSVPNIVDRLRRWLSPTRVPLILELLELRRRAAAKFAAPDRMFFTRTALEQATDECVGAYKASRFATMHAAWSSSPLIADLCCGIGGDLLALCRATPAVGVDRDPIAAHLAAINTAATVHCADATQFDLGAVAAWHIDPNRRPAGHRTSSLAFCQPDLAAIQRLLARTPDAAVKLAPASKVPEHWAERCELEWISRDRQCRQLVAWHGALASAPGQRRATVLPRACDFASGLPPRTLSGTPNRRIPLADQPDRYLFDVDPAVSAARLTGTLAAEHNLTALAPGPTYLTGPRAISDAALCSFEVEDILPLNVRKLARHLRARRIGQLEIKKRSVDLAPEQLRHQLKLSGDRSATLLLTRIATRHAAILAHRLSGNGDWSPPSKT